MGWSNYLYNEEKNVAICINKFDINDHNENLQADYDEFSDYMNNNKNDINFEVLWYLWKKLYSPTGVDIMINVFMQRYDNWKIISEDKFSELKNPIVID